MGGVYRDRSRGLTMLELLVLVAIAAGGVSLGLFWLSANARSPGGVIPGSFQSMGRTLVVAGGVYGYPAVDGTAGGIPVAFPPDTRPGIDGISVPVQLLVGSDPLDMGSVVVTVRSGEGMATLPRDDRRPIGRPAWTVADKSGVLPFHDADRDDLLEPGETFRVLVLPPEPLAPGEHVTVSIAPPRAFPLVVDRDIPARLSPVTALSF